MKINWHNCIMWTACFIASIIGWVIIGYMITQIYFWFNPSPSPFWFFTIFNQGGE